MASLLIRKPMYISLCIFFLIVLGTAACSADTDTGSTATSTPPAINAASATAAEEALIQEMTFVGKPTARIVSGTTFEVDGQIKNGDTKQHDIWIEATLLDASGKPIVTTAPYNVDDTPGETTVPFAVQGTTPQPTWASVRVTVVKVTENVNGTGTD
jgi:hypothetical protein